MWTSARLKLVSGISRWTSRYIEVGEGYIEVGERYIEVGERYIEVGERYI